MYNVYPHGPCIVYMYLHEWLSFMVNVGKYSIHGAFGIQIQYIDLCFWIYPHMSAARSQIGAAPST